MGYQILNNDDSKYNVNEASPLFMDNIYQLSISNAPAFDGQYGFDSDLDLASGPNSIQNDLYVGLNGSWNLLKEMTFTATDLTISNPTSLIRSVESDDNIGLPWTAQRTTGYLARINSKLFVAKYNDVREKITARVATELKLSDYATLEAALTALNSAGAGSQLNIDESKTTAADDEPPTITVDDVVIYSDNQSVITLGTNNTGSHPFYFTGDNVHIMGVSVDIDKDNQSQTHHGIYHVGCDDFSVIGCDVRNSDGYNYNCSDASNGIYGACIGIVGGDDCFTAILACDNVTIEFCVGGCSDNTFGSSNAFEFEDGDTFCTFYKCIAFGQIRWGAFDIHTHNGQPLVSNALFEECISIYNSWSYEWGGNNLTTEVISDSSMINCRDVYSLYRACDFTYIKDCTFRKNEFDLDGTKPVLIIQADSSGSTISKNNVQGIWIFDGSGDTINENDVHPTSGSIGIYLKDTNDSTILSNNGHSPGAGGNTAFIRIEDSDDNIVNSNIVKQIISRGVYLLGTSDNNIGFNNDLDLATTEVLDDSSGTNNIS